MLERPKVLPFDDVTREDETASTIPLTQIAWQRLRDDIICGKLRPKRVCASGNCANFMALAQARCGSAVTSCAGRLRVSLDRRGFIVAPISLRELRELTDLRKLLEKKQPGFHWLVAMTFGSPIDRRAASLDEIEYQFSGKNVASDERVRRLTRIFRHWSRDARHLVVEF